MKLRIACDGRTTVILDEAGNDITEHVYAVEWSHTSGRPPEAKITFRVTALDWVGAAREHTEAVVSEADLNGRRQPT